MFDVVALGELLIDFAPVGERTFQANAGGAPANVLAAVAKLGRTASFIGMVGQDDFGDLLEADVRAAGIDTSALRRTNEASTTLAFVQLDEHGDRSFTFVRKPGADMLLRYEDVDLTLIDSARIFHYGSVSMTGGSSREATLQAAQYARSKGVIVSYDPNLRPLLWKNLDEAKEVISRGLRHADIVKISEEELSFLTKSDDLDRGAAILMEQGIRLVLITLGPKGAYFCSANGSGLLPTYDVKVVDTTGAGDAFLGGVLYSILQTGLRPEALSKEQLEKIVDFGNCVGSLATIQKGAIPAMPGLAAVEHCMQHVAQLTSR